MPRDRSDDLLRKRLQLPALGLDVVCCKDGAHKGTGVDGVALVSAIFAADDIETECKELKALSEQII